jgi:hypothetical protein
MRAARIVALICALASSASAQITDPPELGDGPETDCVAAVQGAQVPEVAGDGRALASMTPEQCEARLSALGIAFEPAPEVPGVRAPVRLRGPLAGIAIEGRADVLDCRLALALATWSSALRARGVRALRSLSVHRPGAHVAGSRRVSGHAHALAIDVGALELDDDTTIDVLEGWEARAAGADPCGEYPESERSTLLRSAVCAAVEADLFQIVLTPHHDRAHQNHVHLELVPDVPWSYVR